MTHSGKELIFLAHLFGDIGIPVWKPIPLLVNNQLAIALTENPIFHVHSKHIKVQHHWMHEKVGDGMIKLEYIPTSDQVAVIFTKPLNLEKFWNFRDALGLIQLDVH